MYTNEMNGSAFGFFIKKKKLAISCYTYFLLGSVFVIRELFVYGFFPSVIAPHSVYVSFNFFEEFFSPSVLLCSSYTSHESLGSCH